MRLVMLCALAAPAFSSPALCADAHPPPPPAVYGAPAPPPLAYGTVAPPGYVYVPPSDYGPPPVVAYGAPPRFVRPGGVIAAPEGPAYAVPAPAYQAGDEYVQQTVLVDGRRYYRECRWEFGYRRCFLRHKAWFW